MTIRFRNILAAIVLAVSGASIADAAVLKFEAISATAGSLGWFTMNDSILNGTNFQSVFNSNILSAEFTNPTTLVSFGTVDIANASRTIFDSSGAIPTVVGGSGYFATKPGTGGVLFAGASFVTVDGLGRFDVSWVTTQVSAVPLPAGGVLLLGGLGAMAVFRRKKRAQT